MARGTSASGLNETRHKFSLHRTCLFWYFDPRNFKIKPASHRIQGDLKLIIKLRVRRYSTVLEIYFQHLNCTIIILVQIKYIIIW